jgi:YVTN family beta-propeller protein
VASPATAPAVQTTNGTTNATIRFSFNSAAARGVGTVTPPHDFVITSPEAINIPDRIRVYENNRDTEARGTVLSIPTGISPAEQLEDLIYDQPRQRLYIANSGLNRVEIYDIRQGRLLAPIKVGQLPRSMALTPDGSLLYVANSGSETISIVDPDKLQTVDRILFPPIPFNANLALSTPRVIAASNAGVMIFVGAAAGNGSLWKIVGNTAVPRSASIVIGSNVAGQPNPIPGPVSMAATPGGEFVLLATPVGNLYLYDPLPDDFVQARTIPATAGYVGPIVAGPRGQYFVVNGILLNQALTPVTQAAASQASSLVQVSRQPSRDPPSPHVPPRKHAYRDTAHHRHRRRHDRRADRQAPMLGGSADHSRGRRRARDHQCPHHGDRRIRKQCLRDYRQRTEYRSADAGRRDRSPGPRQSRHSEPRQLSDPGFTQRIDLDFWTESRPARNRGFDAAPDHPRRNLRHPQQYSAAVVHGQPDANQRADSADHGHRIASARRAICRAPGRVHATDAGRNHATHPRCSSIPPARSRCSTPTAAT